MTDVQPATSRDMGSRPVQTPLPDDIDELAAILDSHQNKLTTSLANLRSVIAPTNVKASARQDLHTVSGQATHAAQGAVVTSAGDLRTQRLVVAGLGVVGLIAIVVLLRRRRAETDEN